MKRTHATAATIVLMVAALALVRCGSDEGGADAAGSDSGGAEVGPDGGVIDAADPRCQTPPVLITTHPHAVKIDASTVGQNLVDTRGWNGRLYFGYGDLNWDTGPIMISSYDPEAKTWKDHLSFETERIERFRVIGDHLWAPASDPRGGADPEYAIGSARTTGLRSNPVTDVQYVDLNNLPFLNAAALNGTLYTSTVSPPWTFDGKQWAQVLQLGGFLHPVTIAGQIVYGALGELWAFDGTHRKNLGVQLVDTTLTYTFVKDPIAVLNDSEGRLLVVNAKLETLVTKDLVEWKCVGHAPPDVRSIGSVNGTVYFGGAEGRVYGYAAPSW
jgi:hypothetical protein